LGKLASPLNVLLWLFPLSSIVVLMPCAEETSPKNIATSVKDERFLNFFFSRIRLANNQETEFLQSISFANDYKFVSPCGREVNYIRPADLPIVFHSLLDGNLLYGGGLKQEFDCNRLAVSGKTGKLYHEVDCLSKGSDSKSLQESILNYGLMRSSVAVSISENISTGEADGDNWTYTTRRGDKLINWLPDTAEPGQWAFPYDDG
jgi:hypothetical protein